MRYKDEQGLRRTKLRVGLIEFFCQWLTQEPSPRLGLSSSLGLEENLIESSLNSTILYIYILTICPCYNYKSPMFTSLIPVHVIFSGHSWSDSWYNDWDNEITKRMHLCVRRNKPCSHQRGTYDIITGRIPLQWSSSTTSICKVPCIPIHSTILYI